VGRPLLRQWILTYSKFEKIHVRRGRSTGGKCRQKIRGQTSGESLVIKICRQAEAVDSEEDRKKKAIATKERGGFFQLSEINARITTDTVEKASGGKQ